MYGQFGYDNMIVSIGYCLEHMNVDTIQLDEVADLVHQGGCLNFQYWRDHKPWTADSRFSKPKKP